MDGFWDDVLAMGIYQMEINEDVNPVREFYTLEQAKEYLKTQFPNLYFDRFEIVELIKKGELELRVAFNDEVALAEAWLNEKAYFKGDNGFEYKVNSVITSHNPLSAFEIIFTSSQGGETLNHIYQIIRGNHVTHLSTKYDVLLRRNDKYWKVVDAHIFESGEIENCPKCFLQEVVWVVGAQSLSKFCKKRIWDGLTKDEKYKLATKIFEKHGGIAEYGSRKKAAEELAISRVTLNKHLKIQSDTPIKHLIKK